MLNLVQSKDELTDLIKSYDDIDDKLSKKLLDFINITTNAYEIFKGSTMDEKREFLNFIFSNLTLRDGKVHYSLAFPFNKLQEISNCTGWRESWCIIRTFNELRLDLLRAFVNPSFALLPS